MNICSRRTQRGFVLILALWALGFLTVLALSVGLGTRQKILLLGRLEGRSQAQFAAEAGVKKAVAVLLDDLEKQQYLYSPEAKVRRHNNPEDFAAIGLGGTTAEVICRSYEEMAVPAVERPGLCDEHSRININSVDAQTLSRLVTVALGLDDEKARVLAGAIIDWRDYGQREAVGFFSDDYYKNLEYPYEMKATPFERIDELLLVKGIDLKTYERLRPLVTIYGDGRLNVNTVPKAVLLALGLDVTVADKFLKARRGPDNRDSTADDHVFLKTFDIAAEVNSLVPLEEKEARQLDILNAANLLCTESQVYSLTSRVIPDGEGSARLIDAVYDAAQNKFLFWVEK